MAEPSESLFLGVFSDECWAVFVEGVEQLCWRLDVGGIVARVDYFLPCALQVISRLIGFAIILGSRVLPEATLKLPQIYSIYSNKSAAGLALMGFYLDVAVFVASVAYCIHLGHEFSTYGEQLIILAQNVVLVLLAWRYETPKLSHIASVTVCGAAVVAACTAVPAQFLWVLPSAAIVAALGARVPQIAANARQKHTGTLSVSRLSPSSVEDVLNNQGTTLKLNTLGAVARVFTTLQSHGDVVILLGYAISIVLNVTLILQIAAYRSNTRVFLEKNAALRKQPINERKTK